MATPMKVIIIVSAIFVSLICIVGGIIGVINTGQKSVLIMPAAGFLILLALCSWPIGKRIASRLGEIDRIAIILARIMGICLLAIQAVCIVVGAAKGNVFEGFSYWSGIALILGGIALFSAFILVFYVAAKYKTENPYQRVGGTMIMGFLAVAAIGAPWEKVKMDTLPSLSYWGFILAAILIVAMQLIVKNGKTKPGAAGLFTFPYTVLTCSWAILEGYACWIFLFTDTPWYEKLLIAIPDVAVIAMCIFMLPYMTYQYFSGANR